MEISYILAKLFGIYFIVMGLFLILKRNELRIISQNMAQNPALVVTNGVLSFLFGLLILLVHPILELSWRGFITVVCGGLPVLVGLARMFFFGRLAPIAEKGISGQRPIIFGVLLIVAGLWLFAMSST